MTDSNALRSPLNAAAQLESLFLTNRNRDWYFVKPGGNWGDELIYAGAESLARRTGLRWTDLDFRTFEPDSIPSKAAIYLHGGGGFNPWGSRRAFSNLEKALAVPDALTIQGPQTTEAQASATSEIFASIFSKAPPRNLHFFARELTSYEYLQSILPPSVHLYIDHDTALNLNYREALGLANLEAAPSGRYALVVARGDDEAPAQSPKGESSVVVMDPAYYASSFNHWIRIHAFARRILTNRLHSAVIGSILGKPVQLMPGSYHKNRSIWEFSLSARGVEWCEESFPAPNKKIARIPLPKWIALSWKFQRTCMRLKGVPSK